jgi:cobalt/nickel transport system permease protein
MSLLALTTPLVDLIALLQRLRVPDLLIDLMTISLRSIFVLLATIERIYVAQDSRLGYRNAVRSFVSAANLGSRIFLETLRRTRQLGIALESRGYPGGALPLMPLPYRRSWIGWLLTGLVAVTLGFVWWVDK